MTKKNVQRLGAAIALLIGIGYVGSTFLISTYTSNPLDMGARPYPFLLGGLFIILSISWWVQTYVARPSAHPKDSSDLTDEDHGPFELGEDFSWPRAGALVAVSFLAVYVLEWWGFLIVGALYLVGSIMVMRWTKPTPRQIILTIITGIIGAFAVKFLLSDLLAIYLP
ncbi:tripartite tricarboxylate transporter TctB family protein [Corynebacterium uropygiale]|uniref:Tripartite tricarboxylate transporter TctB family protein n=1 Tax=Corynebacterium uropygiale TaxID=1775911 RepID=A0A9X1QM01_9CORY|nr:tripartite tricarboxylate transporter TctB family protein [Corynebacterium uropygiale]MCF4005712.1 tripartite tricarboxylate transporter TctB family protein [Corynebacterium uropygiale]